ncbi:hypothetical protein MSAN_01351100 [Mycena sanguinolenta]|uniref:F-box domain-containing protein n=1 Tax=Mycena sanguinolenta TaxID=230812 RepID=A0A8H6YD68_9AGAR|nr:hypothetical protein MSAN_01351100 [Mycena sanguinolenta]
MTYAPVSVRAILVEQIERTRQSSKTDIERLIQASELKLTYLEWQTRTFVELRDRERAYVESLKYIISPIRTLPIELLVEIFRFAINDETHVKDAYRISQICADWRKVAHATLRLWTRPIRVDLGSRRIHGKEQFYAYGLGAWLARSAPLPLPVSLQLDLPTADPRILGQVIRIAPRIRSLNCSDYFPFSLISRLARCRLDCLEELELGLTDVDIPQPPALTTVPRLRKSSITIQSAEPHVLVPWAQLTDLALDSDSPSIILDILSQCPTLTHASICTSGWPGYIAAPMKQPPLPFSHLHTLSLDFGYSEHVMPCLGSLSTPALEALHLNFVEMQDTMESEEPLTRFLMRSPNITRLEILSGRYAPASHELIAVLRHAPRLTHLKLAYTYDHSLNDTLLHGLSYKDNVAPLVPDLHNLVLDSVDEDGFSTNALEHLFVSR